MSAPVPVIGCSGGPRTLEPGAASQVDPAAGRDRAIRHALLAQQALPFLRELSIGGGIDRRFHDLSDVVAPDDAQEAAEVVAVRVREQHHVQPVVPERQRLAQLTVDDVAVGPAVDEQLLPVRRANQDRIALADVEDLDRQPSVRRGEDARQVAVRRREHGHPGEQRRQRQARRQPGRGYAAEGSRGHGEDAFDGSPQATQRFAARPSTAQQPAAGGQRPIGCGAHLHVEASHLERGEGHRRKEPDHRDHVAQAQPGEPAGHVRQRRRRQADDGNEGGAEQDEREGGKDQQVRGQGDERDPLEVEGNQRQRRDGGRGGDDRDARRGRRSRLVARASEARGSAPTLRRGGPASGARAR